MLMKYQQQLLCDAVQSYSAFDYMNQSTDDRFFIKFAMGLENCWIQKENLTTLQLLLRTAFTDSSCGNIGCRYQHGWEENVVNWRKIQSAGLFTILSMNLLNKKVTREHKWKIKKLSMIWFYCRALSVSYIIWSLKIN